MTEQPKERNDIVARLRVPIIRLPSNYEADYQREEAAAEITHLRAQRDRLLAALLWIEDQDPQVVDAALKKFNRAAIAAVEKEP